MTLKLFRLLNFCVIDGRQLGRKDCNEAKSEKIQGLSPIQLRMASDANWRCDGKTDERKWRQNKRKLGRHKKKWTKSMVKD